MTAGERRVAHVLVEGGNGPVECALEDRPNPVAHLGGVAVARQVDERGDEALEHVLADEHRDALPLLELQNAHRDPEQLVLAHLEDFVARQGLEDLRQLLAGVAGPREAGALDDAGSPSAGAAGPDGCCARTRPM